jgi:hypothetical protein
MPKFERKGLMFRFEKSPGVWGDWIVVPTGGGGGGGRDDKLTDRQKQLVEIAELIKSKEANGGKVIGSDGTNLIWTEGGGGGGSVTDVTGTLPVVSSGGATPAISLASGYGDTQNPYASKTANFVLAAPNGSSGVPTFRAVVAADIPTLNQNTTGTAANVTGVVAVANGGTGTATPSLVAGTNITISGTFPNQTINSTGGGGSLIVQDEGSTLTSAATSLNFTGAGVTATNTGGAVTVAVTGGGGGDSSPIPKLQSWSIGAM